MLPIKQALLCWVGPWGTFEENLKTLRHWDVLFNFFSSFSKSLFLNVSLESWKILLSLTVTLVITISTSPSGFFWHPRPVALQFDYELWQVLPLRPGRQHWGWSVWPNSAVFLCQFLVVHWHKVMNLILNLVVGVFSFTSSVLMSDMTVRSFIDISFLGLGSPAYLGGAFVQALLEIPGRHLTCVSSYFHT